MDEIIINPTLKLSQTLESDIPLLVEYLNDKDIYRNTLKIPYPYTEEDGKWYVKHVANQKKERGLLVNWSLRDGEGKLIGGAGFQYAYGPHRITHKDEIGYWLAKPYWGQGIMPKVVCKMCEVGFGEFGLQRIQATVFLSNHQSAKVLEKCGFEYEGFLRKYLVKNGETKDVRMYAKLSSPEL